MIFDLKILISTITVISSALIGHFFVLIFFKLSKIENEDDKGTGKWIGFFERALVALFVCLNLISQTVFIFAVKAAVLGYRLPDDKDHRKRLSEFMLLGSMISYFVALVIGLTGRWLMELVLKG